MDNLFMTDKERILYSLVQTIYKKAIFSSNDVSIWKSLQDGYFKLANIKKGDLVIPATSIEPNPFFVAYVEDITPEYVLLREIGGDKTCKYSNEGFLVIPKDIIGKDLLEGVQYQTYQKTLKAFGESKHTKLFSDIEFDGNECSVSLRKIFSNETYTVVKFPYNENTTVEFITEQIDNHLDKIERQMALNTIHAPKGECGNG